MRIALDCIALHCIALHCIAPTDSRTSAAMNAASSTRTDLDGSTTEKPFRVVIIGAGMAGLTCARQLLESSSNASTQKQSIHVTLVEAMDQVGGRVRKAPGNLDLGAEFVHGRGHILWKWIHEFQDKGWLPRHGPVVTDAQDNPIPEDFENGLEPFFIVSHADGGPDYGHTSHGKYGMYYVDSELLMYNDPKIEPLSQALETAMDRKHYDDYTDQTSVEDALVQISNGVGLSKPLQDLCKASYGNTAGSCDLANLSARQMIAFEHYWQTNELEGDFRPTFCMHRIVSAIVDNILNDKAYKDSFTLKVNTPVSRVLPKTQGGPPKVVVQTGERESIEADAVVVAVPPTQLAKIFNQGADLTEEKRRGLLNVGCSRVSKVCCRFRKPLWPENLQSLIAADEQPVPEMWFRQGEGHDVHYAVGYMGSESADEFYNLLQARVAKNPDTRRDELAGAIFLEELSTILSIPMDVLIAEYVPEDAYFFDWKEDHPYTEMGYMFPKTGMTAKDLDALAKPMDKSIYFAGEATNTNACCTVQAAMETGVRAANQVLEQLQSQR